MLYFLRAHLSQTSLSLSLSSRRSELEAFNPARCFGYCLGILWLIGSTHRLRSCVGFQVETAPQCRRGVQPEEVLAEVHRSAVGHTGVWLSHYKSLFQKDCLHYAQRKPITETKWGGNFRSFYINREFRRDGIPVTLIVVRKALACWEISSDTQPLRKQQQAKCLHYTYNRIGSRRF